MSCPFLGRFHVEKTPSSWISWIPDFFAGRDLAAAELHLLQALYVLATTVKHFHDFIRRDISKECLEASLNP